MKIALGPVRPSLPSSGRDTHRRRRSKHQSNDWRLKGDYPGDVVEPSCRGDPNRTRRQTHRALWQIPMNSAEQFRQHRRVSGALQLYAGHPKSSMRAMRSPALQAGCLSRSERSDFNVAKLCRGSRKPPVEAHHCVTPFRLGQVKSIGEIHAPNRPVQSLSGQRCILQSHAR
jgi:hypothetical protein